MPPPNWMNGLGRMVRNVVIVLSMPLLMLIALVAGIFDRGIKRTREEVADILERFITNVTDEWEWDDFICISITDPQLNSIRERCAQLPQEYPPKNGQGYCDEGGIEVIRQFILQLRGGITERKS
jgi:hypothetical protein